MVIDADDEILQDFLLEAGEIVELLSQQLLGLEQAPADVELLNAIFRGFHTIKGGAGFLGIEPLVSVCHKAEDVFNCLRSGNFQVSRALMDVILEALDVVFTLFEQLRSGQALSSIDTKLLKRLQAFVDGTPEIDIAKHKVAEQESVQVVDKRAVLFGDDLISEDEFDDLLDQFQAKVQPSDSEKIQVKGHQVNAADEISEAEFDDLLDQLQAKKQLSEPAEPQVSTNQANNSDEISEAEFDDLLDQIQAKSKPKVVSVMLDRAPIQAVKHDEISEDEFEDLLNQIKAKQSSGTAPIIPVPLEMRFPPENVSLAPKPASVNQAETTVRVDTQVLDNIMNMVGELVLIRNRLQTLKATLDVGEPMNQTLANLNVVTADLQLAVTKTRMQPIKKIFGRFPRVVRDLSRSLNKEIRLELVGEETDLDKNLVEALADPLVHLIRNAVDHGIETPAERESAGKPREGLIVLKAAQVGDHIELSIQDNGKGMDPNLLRAKVIEKGLMDKDAAARLENKECFNLIFMPGFSTKTEISDISGRGVGMDVVKTRINQMNGVIEIDSQIGVGSNIVIKVPLTLAIMPTLMVKLGQQVFALPLTSVLEILNLDLNKANVVHNQLVVMVRGKTLPLFYLSEWLINDPAYQPPNNAIGHVVVVNASGRQIGFVVDQLLGQEEVVIKALGAKLQGLAGLSGATITGDGKVALILDVPGLMQKYVN